MAELLLYARTDFCQDAKHPERLPIGAAVQIEESGFWKGGCKGFGSAYFDLLEVKDKTKKDLLYLLEPDEERSEFIHEVYQSRKYVVDTSALEKEASIDRLADITIIDKEEERLNPRR